MGCVAKSTKEFKDLATRNNVDSNILELIIHKYWLETGNELHFPTDLYIQSQLGMGVYKESGKSVRKLWELKYNTPKKYNSLQEVKVAVAEAGKYFPASAIYFHKNADGKYTLTVKRPVEHIDNSKDSFFQEYDGGTSIKNARKLSLGIEEGRVYSLDKVQELYNKFNTDRTSQALADRAFNVARELGLQITFDESLPFGITGRYSNDNTLRFKKSFLERDMMNSKKAPIILHEVLHALSMYALSNQTKNWKRGEALEGFRTEMNSLYQDLKNNPILKDERGITDLHEFVAELANPVFREKIKNIDRDVAAEKKLEKKSFWRRIVDAFKNLLGLHTTNTYYQRSMNALEKALDAFDIDTYMKYNGVKNFLRQGYNAKEWEFNATSDKEIKTQVEDYVNNLPDTQLNETFNVINKAKESGKWTPEALKTLDNLITDIENGKVTYQRFPQEASRASYQGGRANEAASILLSTNESSDSRNPRAVRERYERDKREQPIQERIVEAWAKAKGIWHDNLDTIEGKEQIGKGGEAKVFANDGDINVTKILSTEYFVTPQFALDRITLHNTLFPEAPLKVLGFGRNSKGEFQFLVEQPFIQGKHATKKEIHDFISKMGFTKTDKDRGNTFISDDLYLSDLHDENVIKVGPNTFIVIDADLRLNTPELNRNGKYKINNAITSTQEVYKKTFIRTLSGKQLKQELATIKQENADYNLLHNIKPEQKHSDKAVPQDFTFADGTKVKAPFKPNAQQVEALNAIDDFIKSKETSMTLSGYAGTGKTSIMEMIAQKVQKQGKRVVFCASTNKAAAVLQNRVSKAGFEASTLNKVFGISVEVKQSNSHYDAQDLETVLKEANIERGTTVFIDEASMINEKNYHILNDIADKEGLKLIYVGDAAQLAPIGETKVSKVFRNGDGKVVTLTQVERTGDNAILREATDIRNGKPLSKESSFNSKGEGVAYISPMHQDAINEVIQTYIKGLKQNPDFFRILAYSNKAVADYNNQVRELLGYTSALPEVGEPMVGYANWGYDWKDKSYKFINSEAYKVVSVHKPKTVVCHLFDGTPITMEALPITLQDSLGHKNTFRYMDITHNSKNRENAMRLAKEKARLWVDVKRAPKGTKKNYYAKINEIEEFLFVNDDLKDGKYTLQSKVIDFGYAMTIHKSQGSTFTHVLMDDVDITKYTGNNSFEEISSIDLGDDTSVDFSNAEMIEESPVDLGNLEEADTAPVIPETVDERQQLEYVGVSRATDTVTVISNGVKKEGSPLHPEKAIKEDKSRYSNKISNETRENEVIDKYSSSLNITQNASGRLGEADLIEETSYREAKEILRNPNSTKEEVEKAEETLNELYAKKKTELQQILNEVTKISNVSFSIDNAGGSWLGGEEYSFRINLKANTQEDYNKALQAISYVAEGLKQDAFIENLGEVDRKEVSKESLLSGEHTPCLHVPFARSLTMREIALVQKEFNDNSSDNLPLDATITDKEIIFNFPSWKIDDNPSEDAKYKAYKDLFDKWYDKLKKIITNGRNGRFSEIYRGDYSCRYERSRFHSADSTEGTEREYSVYRNNNFPKEQQNLSEEEGRGLKAYSSTVVRTKPKDFSEVFQLPTSPKVEVEDRIKPWKNDISKSNKSRRIYLKGQKDKGYFEVVKDTEDNNYSVHFKPTDSKNPNAFTQEEKTILFQTVADIIPEGANLSTWGELSEGGVHGLNRFSELGFTKTGERDAKMKSGEDIKIPIFTKNSSNTTSMSQHEEASSEVKDNTQDSTIVENLVEKGEEPQQISLPNYENIKGYYNATPVDAAWKIPYLQELDEKLDTLGAMEENQPVVEEMDRLLQATTEKEYKATQKDKTKTEVDSIIAQYDKLNKHIDKLLDNQHGLKASEVRHCATQIADAISDDINSLQKIPNLAEQWFPALNTDIDFQTASRKQIVTTVGINALIQRARERFSSADYDDVDTILQMDLIVENWDALMTFATDSFAFNEGFGIKKNYKTGRYELTSQSKIDVDNFQDYSNDPDVAEETGAKDSQEYWQVESKTVAVINSMSALVKQGLHECYLVDAEGNKILSKWGIPERVNPREATNSILRWARGSKSLSDMVAKMSAKQQQHPWLAQLITRLSDKSGKETDFQSQFFNVFSKDHQLYSIVLMEDGMYHSMLANRNSTLSDAMQSISAQFTIGEHPLFTGSKVKSDALGSSTTTNKDAAFSLHKAHTELSILNDRLKKEELSTELMQEASANIAGVCRLLGFNADEKALKEAINKESLSDMTYSLGWIIKNLDAVRQSQLRGENKDYNPFKFKGDNSIDGHVRNFLAPIAEVMQDSGTNAFYDSGKMYQSYITPSFMTRLMNTFHQEDTEAFKDFMLNEYGSSEFFKTKTKGPLYDKMGWRNEWMNRMYNDKQMRHIIDHKVELNFNKHNYMRNMTDTEYTLSVLAEYLSEPAVDGVDVAWFRVPIQSNKPSSDFIRFYAYKDMSNYKESILSGLHSIYLQELDRISTVKARNLSKGDPAYINNFDEVGRSFCFLPVLNDYLEDSTAAKAKRNILTDKEGNISADNEKLAQLLQKKLEGKKALTEDEEVKLSQLIDDVLRQHMENRTANIIERWEKEGIIEAAKKVQGLGKEDADVKKVLENFIWNDAYASKIILQLTIGDIAFYENTENLQKRLSQLHSPGTRANVEATDYKGNRVSDGKYRTVILNDFDSFKSNIIDNINEVFERKIKAANDENSKAVLRSLKDSLTAPRVVDAKTGKVIEKGGSFWNINVTDAQGFSSPSSYRKKAFMFGKWSNNSERIYNLLKQNKANLTDLQTAFQPMKPFVFSVLHKNMNAANAPITSMPVPFQAKNSEYLLIMADALLQGEELGRPNLLRAIYRVMEESEKRNPTKGIDTVQFESAIKSGLQGTIDIAQFRESTTGEEDAYNLMMKSIYKEGTSDYNTDVFVQETTYDHYCMQQEVPAHFRNHTQAHGSQIRMIIPSDLDLYTTDESGAMVTNYYEWTEPDGTKRKVTADEFKKEYERTIADSIDESIINLSKELHLDSDNIKERNIALSKILQNEIVSSPRYGIDLLQACSIDLETGEFRIPKGDPIQAKRIEQLINSIIKNRINKQKIAGGPIVQVSNFGTSKQLHIRFNDKQGNLIPLREEYKPAEHDGLSYEKFLEKHQGGIAYFEVYVPIWSEELVEKFGKPDGSIDVDLIEQIDPELLKMVSYRIPTEDKYSCAPMKVVGFMPREAGDAIMFPYELTEIDDSDFDVDKRYVMRKDIPILTRPRKEIEDKLFKKASESYAKAHEGHSNNTMIRNQVKMFLDNPQKMKDVDTLMQSLWQEYRKVAYYTEAPVSGKKYRDNKIVDMSYAVLTNQMTADKILNPGGFEGPKKVAYMITAYKNPENANLKWEELEKMSTKELKKLSYTDKDLSFIDTQIQFYKQNAAAGSLIGVFAVNKVAHATLEGDDIWIAVNELCDTSNYFSIAGCKFGGRMQIDPKYDLDGNLIGKSLGSMVSASADAAKDPILNLMNINMVTSGTFNTLLRLGMPFRKAAMFLSQNVLEDVIREFNRTNLNNYSSLNDIINARIKKLAKEYKFSSDSEINTEDISESELREGLTSKEHAAIDYKVLIAYQRIKSLADAMRKPTFVTRFNSIQSAVGPLIIDNLILEHKMKEFNTSFSEQDSTGFYTADGIPVDIDDICADHPILKGFSSTVALAKGLFRDMPAGSNGFEETLNNLPKDISAKMFGDKKLLDDFSNFYQSYLLVQSGFINPTQLGSYIKNFPTWFVKENLKEKYKENALIQAIQINTSKKTGLSSLSINLTGMDENLRSAWIDLHKQDPKLSKMLFDYSFFVGGAGFSPKTFMALVPTYVKARLKAANGVSYVDTYRDFPVVPNKKLLIQQFICNNWNDNKLVPKKGDKNSHFKVDLKKGTLQVITKEDMDAVGGVSYMKTKDKGITYLWKLIDSSAQGYTYERIMPLGGNGEYLEMSTADITKPMMETTQTIDDIKESSLKEQAPAEDTNLTTTSTTEESTEKLKNRAEMIDLIMKQNPKLTKAEAGNMFENIKKNPKLYKRFLPNVYKHKGLTLNEEEAVKKFTEMC